MSLTKQVGFRDVYSSNSFFLLVRVRCGKLEEKVNSCRDPGAYFDISEVTAGVKSCIFKGLRVYKASAILMEVAVSIQISSDLEF